MGDREGAWGVIGEMIEGGGGGGVKEKEEFSEKFPKSSGTAGSASKDRLGALMGRMSLIIGMGGILTVKVDAETVAGGVCWTVKGDTGTVKTGA